jgi:hypothetical protein
VGSTQRALQFCRAVELAEGNGEMLLRKVARHPQVGRRHDCKECAGNDPRAIPAVEDADIVLYRLIILLPFLQMEPEPM